MSLTYDILDSIYLTLSYIYSEKTIDSFDNEVVKQMTKSLCTS